MPNRRFCAPRRGTSARAAQRGAFPLHVQAGGGLVAMGRLVSVALVCGVVADLCPWGVFCAGPACKEPI